MKAKCVCFMLIKNRKNRTTMLPRYCMFYWLFVDCRVWESSVRWMSPNFHQPTLATKSIPGINIEPTKLRI